MAEQSFTELVNRAIEEVRHRNPTASFIEAEGMRSSGSSASSVSDLDRWRFVFDEEEGGIVVVMVNGTEMGPVQYSPEDWVDDRFIPWPLKMGPADALRLIVAAGHTGKFTTLSLRWPRYPGIEQAQYIFEMEDESYVFVGVGDGTVQVHR